ncbi:hypothetical protein PF005_g3320 [Phytophthora fragariae]|uniref:Uncharacterized protein n=1 Tax=Phytophthora fragariae TaxID=53985 RepID=A0A6A3TEB6_9STRA|nr:hypothetical protein PF003_g548 [Phytophthora fragariae]KAE8948464.1 hypothetical protein PF009_g1971 [Phytophthora fragariae]KAE9023496.1 hypothetical protein PF011_g3943 [Phytophthora fragariae]KAE9131221.1 hypothetical protein PF010_g3572 [Phytophthora fragariae]KAE9134684.1 hypothetical protein PF007_g2843 [Phytophthora fragariae]
MLLTTLLPSSRARSASVSLLLLVSTTILSHETDLRCCSCCRVQVGVYCGGLHLLVLIAR